MSVSVVSTISIISIFRGYRTVNQKLNISMTDCNDYKISLIDISGRIVLESSFYDKDVNLDLSNILPGVYTLEIKTKTISKYKKLVVE